MIVLASFNTPADQSRALTPEPSLKAKHQVVNDLFSPQSMHPTLWDVRSVSRVKA